MKLWSQLNDSEKEWLLFFMFNIAAVWLVMLWHVLSMRHVLSLMWPQFFFFLNCNTCTICHYLVSDKTCRHRCTFCHLSDKTCRNTPPLLNHYWLDCLVCCGSFPTVSRVAFGMELTVTSHCEWKVYTSYGSRSEFPGFDAAASCNRKTLYGTRLRWLYMHSWLSWRARSL